MEASKHRVFYYHADASPFGGHLTHPIEKIVQAQASSSLAQAGGHASSRIGPFRLNNIASCDAAYSEIFGTVNKANGAWTTLVTSVVERLNVLEVVTADRVVSRLAVEYPREGYCPKVSFVGSHFENLRIAGVRVNPVLNLDLLPSQPENKFPDRPFIDDKSFIDKAIDQSRRMLEAEKAPDWLRARYSWVSSEEERDKKGYVLCSLVEQVGGAKPGSSYGHVIHVPGFGNVFLGELIVAQGLFRLTMIRTEMGCLAEGTLSFATADSNGFPMP
jgi:hypothetical protein